MNSPVKIYVPRTSYETLEGAPDERVQMDMTDLDVAGEVTGLIVAASIVVLTNNPYAISTNASVIQLSTSVYSGSIDSDRGGQSIGALHTLRA